MMCSKISTVHLTSDLNKSSTLYLLYISMHTLCEYDHYYYYYYITCMYSYMFNTGRHFVEPLSKSKSDVYEGLAVHLVVMLDLQYCIKSVP